MKNSLWYGDLHTHTNLSLCSPKEVVPEMYIPACEGEKIKVLGFSNHLYAPYTLDVNSRDKYLGVERVLQIEPQLKELKNKTDVEILMGCEVETIYGKEPTLPKEYAKRFDYILLAASHIMNLPSEYANYDLSTPKKLRDLIIERFIYDCNLDFGVPTAICHPFYAICCPFEQEIIDGISDSKLAECFSLAAKKGISMEIHACLYRRGTRLNEKGLSPSYLRMLSAAKACGCKFHFGADAHTVGAFTGVHEKLREAASSVGISEADMWKF